MDHVRSMKRKLSRGKRSSSTIKQEENLREGISHYALDCGFALTTTQLDDVVTAVKDHASPDQEGIFHIGHQLLDKKLSLTLPNLHRKTTQLSQKRNPTSSPCCNCNPTEMLKWKNVSIWLVIYVIMNAALMVYRGLVYRNEGAAIIIARASGMGLYFNVTLSTIWILRRTISLLRKTFFANILPLDDHISIHKFIGKVIFFLGLIHAVAHIVRYATSTKLALWECLFTTRAAEGWVFGSAGITGVILLAVSMAITMFSLSYFRRHGYFELFHWVHHLSIVYWIALIFHAKDFWMWFVLPGSIYMLELASKARLVIFNKSQQLFQIADYDVLPSKVTKLKIKRCIHFSFSPGDYVFINIPDIARHEWHPFTISSAPEEQGYFTVHIRSLGNWTRKLHTRITFFDCCSLLFSNTVSNAMFRNNEGSDINRNEAGLELEQINQGQNKQQQHHDSAEKEEEQQQQQTQHNETQNPKSSLDREPVNIEVDDQVDVKVYNYAVESSSQESSRMTPDLDARRDHTTIAIGHPLNRIQSKIYVDGPYGSPSSEIFNSKHAILIAAGIGVTPFASILQSIMYRYKNSKAVCPSCNHEWLKEIPSFLNLKKVDFVWINSDVKAFEWFLSILDTLEKEQAKIPNDGVEFLSTHLFLRGVFAQANNHQATQLKMALDISYEKHNVDILTGLRSKLHKGAPDWNKIFSPYASFPFGKPHVFFCGPVALGNAVKASAMKYKFKYRKEKF